MRKPITLIFLLSFFFFISEAQSPDWQWEKKMGSLYMDNSSSIVIDVAGNVFTTGGFQGTCDFDPGLGVFNIFVSTFGNITNLFVSKLDAGGNFVWAKSIGNEQNGAVGHGIRLDHSGNIYVTGTYNDTLDFNPDSIGVFSMIASGNNAVFVLKLDSTGEFIWAGQFEGTDAEDSYGIDLDGDGNVYTLGAFSGTVDFDPDTNSVFSMAAGSSQDVFISKLDSGGHFIWAKQFTGNIFMEGKSIAVDVNSNVYTTGWFQDTVDFDPGPGVFNPISMGLQDIFISKLDSAGNFVWVKSIGDLNSESSEGLTVDASGFVYCTGEFIGTLDFDPGTGIANMVSDGANTDVFVLKLNSNGEYIWAKRMGGPDNDEYPSVAVDTVGNVYTTGLFTSTADFDPDSIGSFLLYNASSYWWDIFVSKLDIEGNFVWAKSMTGTSHDWGVDLVVDDSGIVYLTGAFQSPVLMFDSVQLVNTGGTAEDIWVAKLGSTLSTRVNEHVSEDFKFNIFPNPAGNQFRIDGGQCAINSVCIFNVTGGMVYGRFQLSGSKSRIIDISKLSPGIYFVKVETEKGISVQKLVKQ